MRDGEGKVPIYCPHRENRTLVEVVMLSELKGNEMP